MTKEEYLLELQTKHTDAWGYVTPNGKHPSDNGLLFTAYHLSLMKKNNWELPPQTLAQVQSIIHFSEQEPGLFKRHPNQPGQEQVDDYLGLATLAKLANMPQVSQRILSYGRSHFYRLGPMKLPYHYKNIAKEKDTLRIYLGRFPAMIIAHKMAAGEKINKTEELFLAAALAITPSLAPNNQDQWMQSWMLLQWMPDTAAFNKARTYFSESLAKHKRSLKVVFQEYFPPNHPFIAVVGKQELKENP